MVMDLGSGDGQILFAAAREYGARGIGIEIDPLLVAQARTDAVRLSLADRVEFVEQDIFQADLRPATALMLYLLDSINLRLRPLILAQCTPGTRVVSYSFEMGDWGCDAHTPLAANGVSLWIVPADLSGEWRANSSDSPLALASLSLRQRFQELAGTATVGGASGKMVVGRVRGSAFSLSVEHEAGPILVTGRFQGDQLEASVTFPDLPSSSWKAARAYCP